MDEPQLFIDVVKKINWTPAIYLGVMGWHELLVNKAVDLGVIPLSHESEAIVAMLEGEPVGCIIFQDYTWSNEFWITISYVVPKHRRQKIHTKMFGKLVEVAKERKISCISSVFGLNNEASKRAQLSQGRYITGYTTRYMVSP